MGFVVWGGFVKAQRLFKRRFMHGRAEGGEQFQKFTLGFGEMLIITTQDTMHAFITRLVGSWNWNVGEMSDVAVVFFRQITAQQTDGQGVTVPIETLSLFL